MLVSSLLSYCILLLDENGKKKKSSKDLTSLKQTEQLPSFKNKQMEKEKT